MTTLREFVRIVQLFTKSTKSTVHPLDWNKVLPQNVTSTFMKRIVPLVLIALMAAPAFARSRAVRHPAEACSFSLVPTWDTAPVPAAGLQRGVVLVYGQTALCAQWMSYSNVDWVTVESGPLDAQPAAYVTVAPNGLPEGRTASLTIAGVRLDLTQEPAAAIRTQSLIVNGTFDTNVANWTWQDRFPNGLGASSWSALDANGSPSSGSILMQDGGVVGLAFQRLQCIPVKRSTPYVVGAKVRTSEGSERGNGIIAVFTYPEADCSGQYTSQVIHELRPDAPNVWQEFSFATVTGSRTEALLVVIASSATFATFDTWFDDVVLLP